ncbi:hypothetical protein BYT27DRAFT_7237815 [Phlegmacium glaucopus]|nr:hypothetical protein BYT27DRAFT_7237815 [Phlegmacium glaucopus]
MCHNETSVYRMDKYPVTHGEGEHLYLLLSSHSVDITGEIIMLCFVEDALVEASALQQLNVEILTTRESKTAFSQIGHRKHILQVPECSLVAAGLRIASYRDTSAFFKKYLRREWAFSTSVEPGESWSNGGASAYGAADPMMDGTDREIILEKKGSVYGHGLPLSESMVYKAFQFHPRKS